MRNHVKRTALTAAAILFAAPVLAACGTESTDPGEGGDSGDARALTVQSSEDACDLSASERRPASSTST